MGWLNSKVSVVSGAASVFGSAFAGALASEGASLLLFDIDPSVAQTAATLASRGAEVACLIADVSRRSDCERVVTEAVKRFGGVDILVNNAGMWRQTPLDAPWEQALADFDALMDVNFKGTMMMSRLCVAEMRKRGGGDVVNINTCSVLPSRSTLTSPQGIDAYDASKWALNGLTDLGAQWLKQYNIRVNALALGPTATATMGNAWSPRQEPFDAAATWVRPEPVARLLIDLLKDGRSGENIGVWPGHAVSLGPRRRWDVKIRERADFTGQPIRLFGPPPWADAPEPLERFVVRKE